MSVRFRQTGLTLIELMIGLLVGLLIMAAVIQLFVQTSASSRQNELIAGMQDNARFALSVLADDIRSGGFTGGILSLADIDISDATLADITDDCGTSTQTKWAYNLTGYGGPIQSISDRSPTDAVAAQKCLPSGELPTRSDVLAVKRTLGEAKSGSLTANRVYLRSNGESGCLWFYNGSNSPTSAACPTGTSNDWMYLSHVYYIRNDGSAPNLCRYALGSASGVPRMLKQCLAEGIEYFHIEWGIDSSGDGVVDAYTAAPLDMAKVVAARIYVLSRSTEQLPSKAAVSKDFRLGSMTIRRDDRFYRRVYSTTVLVRNTVNRANLL